MDKFRATDERSAGIGWNVYRPVRPVEGGSTNVWDMRGWKRLDRPGSGLKFRLEQGVHRASASSTFRTTAYAALGCFG